MTRGARFWAGLAALLAALALLGGAWPTAAIDWQPALAAAQPWRVFSAAAVHYSHLHLAANLAGALLVAALGIAAPVPERCTLAWLAAWPATQLGLLFAPGLMHFGGLSGVLHAGVAVVALHLVATAHGQRRMVGAALLAGLALKVIGESPWGPPLRSLPGWDIAIAPVAHASGTLAGLLCGLLAEALVRRRPIETATRDA